MINYKITVWECPQCGEYVFEGDSYDLCKECINIGVHRDTNGKIKVLV